MARGLAPRNRWTSDPRVPDRSHVFRFDADSRMGFGRAGYELFQARWSADLQLRGAEVSLAGTPREEAPGPASGLALDGCWSGNGPKPGTTAPVTDLVRKCPNVRILTNVPHHVPRGGLGQWWTGQSDAKGYRIVVEILDRKGNPTGKYTEARIVCDSNASPPANANTIQSGDLMSLWDGIRPTCQSEVIRRNTVIHLLSKQLSGCSLGVRAKLRLDYIAVWYRNPRGPAAG